MLNPAPPPPWRAADADVWLAARRGSRLHAWLLTAAWIAMIAIFITLEPDLECSDATPCTADWHGMVVVFLTLANLVWLHREPMLAAIVTPVVVLLQLLVDVSLTLDSLWVTYAYLLVSALTFLYVLGAARGRVAQRALAAAATGGYRAVWPAPKPKRSVFNLWLLGTVACLVGAVGVSAYTAMRVDDYDEHVQHAVEVQAEVIDHADDGYVVQVRLRDGDEVEFDTWDAALYPIGSEVTVLADGEWHWLSAEPYDPTYPGALALILLLAGLTLGAVEWRLRRLGPVLHRPHPVLSVLVGADDDGRAAVWPVDAADADRPLFVLGVDPWIGPEEAGDLDGPVPVDDFDDDEEPDLDELAARLRQRDPGVVHGLPYDGGAVALEVHPHGEEPILLLPVQPIRSSRGNADPGAGVMAMGRSRRRAILRADQVRVVEFPTVRVREGYDMMEVDEFLDRVHTELSDVERRRAKPGRTLTPAQTREVQFTTVRIREGYDMRSVDDFLDEVIATLEAQQQADSGAGVIAMERSRRRAIRELEPTHEPRMYESGRGSLTAAVVVGTATQAAFSFMLFDAGAGWFELVLMIVVGQVFLATAVGMAASRLVVADADGIHICAFTGLKTRSWEELMIVDLDTGGPVLVTRDVDRTLVVRDLLGRRRPRPFRPRQSADRMVSELNAMLKEPMLRPQTRWSARGLLSFMSGPRLVMLALAYIGWVVYVWARSSGSLG